MDLTRRELLLGTAVTAAAIAGCGGDDGDGTPIDAPANVSCVNNGTRVNITANHGHTLEISMADVAAGAARTYDITGSGDHSHMVTVSAAQMAMLAANSSIQVTSTAGGAHTHSISVSCR